MLNNRILHPFKTLVHDGSLVWICEQLENKNKDEGSSTDAGARSVTTSNDADHGASFVRRCKILVNKVCSGQVGMGGVEYGAESEEKGGGLKLDMDQCFEWMEDSIIKHCEQGDQEYERIQDENTEIKSELFSLRAKNKELITQRKKDIQLIKELEEKVGSLEQMSNEMADLVSHYDCFSLSCVHG